jgi:hypothetical protein
VRALAAHAKTTKNQKVEKKENSKKSASTPVCLCTYSCTTIHSPPPAAAANNTVFSCLGQLCGFLNWPLGGLLGNPGFLGLLAAFLATLAFLIGLLAAFLAAYVAAAPLIVTLKQQKK